MEGVPCSWNIYRLTLDHKYFDECVEANAVSMERRLFSMRVYFEYDERIVELMYDIFDFQCVINKNYRDE